MSTTVPTLTAATVPALTTTFTPNPSCLSDYYQYNVPTCLGCVFGSGFYISLGPVSTNCFPSGFSSTSQYYSPGVCPSGYTIACSSLIELDTLTETRATCCPSLYNCQTGNKYPWYSTEACTALISTMTVTMGNVTSGVDANTFTTISAGVNAFGVSIRFRDKDFDITTPSSVDATASATKPASASPSSMTSTSATATTNAQPSQTTASTQKSGLSPGAAAATGVIASVAFFALISALIFFIRRHRRATRAQSQAPSMEHFGSGATKYVDPPQEVSGTPRSYELEQAPKHYAELQNNEVLRR